MDIRRYNRDAWNRLVSKGNRWTVPVDHEAVEAARGGRWEIRLTPKAAVPAEWFPPLQQRDVLCLAASGGQQSPLLAAAGARVTVLDSSPRQLEGDRAVARREGLEIATVEADMADLGCFDAASFDLIVNPCSTCFVPDVLPVWRESFRVLRPGGRLMTGFCHPVSYIFDYAAREAGRMEVAYPLPYTDVDHLPDDQRRAFLDRGEPLEFSHSLETQIGGQLQAGFRLIGLFEDGWDDDDVLSRYFPPFIATLAEKPGD